MRPGRPPPRGTGRNRAPRAHHAPRERSGHSPAPHDGRLPVLRRARDASGANPTHRASFLSRFRSLPWCRTGRPTIRRTVTWFAVLAVLAQTVLFDLAMAARETAAAREQAAAAHHAAHHAAAGRSGRSPAPARRAGLPVLRRARDASGANPTHRGRPSCPAFDRRGGAAAAAARSRPRAPSPDPLSFPLPAARAFDRLRLTGTGRGRPSHARAWSKP